MNVSTQDGKCHILFNAYTLKINVCFREPNFSFGIIINAEDTIWIVQEVSVCTLYLLTAIATFYTTVAWYPDQGAAMGAMCVCCYLLLPCVDSHCPHCNQDTDGSVTTKLSLLLPLIIPSPPPTVDSSPGNR